MNDLDNILKIHPSECINYVSHCDAMLKALLWEQAKKNVPWYIIGKQNRKDVANAEFDRLLNLSNEFLKQSIDSAVKTI